MTYPSSEYGNRCGRSWRRNLTVNGKLNEWWGAQYKKTLPPIFKIVPSWGWATGTEENLDAVLRALIPVWYGKIATLGEADVISASNMASLRYLLETAEEHLNAIPAVYEKWDNFECIQGISNSKFKCPWPLDRFGDDPKYWFRQCAEPRPGHTYADDYGRAFTCPPPSIAEDRVADRLKIKKLFLTALHAIRCCQYWVWRAELRHRARATMPAHDPTRTFGPGGQGPRPAPAPPHAAGGGFSATPKPVYPPPPGDDTAEPLPQDPITPVGPGGGVEPIPEEGPIPLDIPDPDTLPPIDPDATTAPGVGDAEPDPPPLVESKKAWWIAGAITVGAVGLMVAPFFTKKKRR